MGNTYQLQSDASNGTTPSSKRGGVPEWMLILETLAADKKTDLHANASQLWKAKLRDYSTSEIKNALLAYRGEFMPSCDDIIGLIERRREEVLEGEQAKRPFVACGRNGCLDGWRPVTNEKFTRYQRCQCLRDHMAGKPSFENDHRKEEREWERYKLEHGLDPDLKYQSWWVGEHKNELAKLVSMKKI